MKALVFDGRVVQIEATEFDVHEDLVWVDITVIVPVPEVGWSYDGTVFTPPPGPSLDELKTAKRRDFVTEGIKRIAAQVPDWDSIETIKTVAGLWPAISATATAAQLKAKDIYLYVRDTVPPKIAAIATEATLAAIDPTAADPFGDGTLWPT